MFHNDTHESSAESIIGGIEQLDPLTEAEKRLFNNEDFPIRQAGPHVGIVSQNNAGLVSPPCCMFLASGLAYSYKTMKSGQRQIVAFHTPGSFCNLSSVYLGPSDVTTAAAAPATLVLIPSDLLAHWGTLHSGLGQLLARMILIQASIAREWLVNVGRRSAYQRTAHLLCELATRVQAAGSAPGQHCPLPLTPLDLADALGLAPVHLNRVLQWLRTEGLLDLADNRLTIPNRSDLERAADFDPAYLHLARAKPENGRLMPL